MLDTLIKDGTVLDGSGGDGVRADVGIRDGRIVSVGSSDEPAARTLNADGLMVAPGFVDPHTHYDAQLLWDPNASPSNLHGVTSVIGGNCGFSLAPIVESEVDYIRRMMAVVEGMPLAALENGIDWSFASFGEYLEKFEGGIAVNAGFLVGHCALRRAVMGEAAVGETATADQLEAMVGLLRESIAAGGLGLSMSRSFTHSDADGQPVPSRFAAVEEVIALCSVLAEHEGTSLEFITDGCLNGFSDDEIQLMGDMSLAAQRPLNWNVFTIDSKEPERFEQQLAASHRAAERGARVVALTMPTLARMTMSFESYSAIHQLPDWKAVMSLPIPERMAALRDPATRRHLEERATSPDAGVFARVADWANFEIGDTVSAANAGLTGRLVKDIAAERGVGVFDTLVDIALADDLKTVLWPTPPDGDADSWALRKRAWDDPYTLLGGSDAGAHLDRMCGAPYTTEFLADCLRGNQLMTVGEAVAALSTAPAELFGLRERGRIVPGYHADLVVFDPETVGCGPVRTADDLPGNSSRLVADAIGIQEVTVGGRAIVVEGRPTGELPGHVLRSGRDTSTPSLAAG